MLIIIRLFKLVFREAHPGSTSPPWTERPKSYFMRPVCTWNVKYSRRELGELLCASQTWKSNTTVPHIKFCIPVPPGNMCNLLSPQLSWFSRLFRTTATLFSLVTRPSSSSSVANSFFFLELCVVQVIYKPRQTVCRFISTKQPQTLTRTFLLLRPGHYTTLTHSMCAHLR